MKRINKNKCLTLQKIVRVSLSYKINQLRNKIIIKIKIRM